MQKGVEGVITTDRWRRFEERRLEEERLEAFKRRMQTMEVWLEKGYTGK